MTPAPIDKKTKLTLRYRYLKVKVEHEQRHFRYAADLIAQRDAVHNQLVELLANERREVSA